MSIRNKWYHHMEYLNYVSVLKRDNTSIKLRKQAEKKAYQYKKEIDKLKLIESEKIINDNKTRSKIWMEEILPNWPTIQKSSKINELCWRGIPSKLRGIVWPLLIGNTLGLSEDVYNSLKLQLDLSQVKSMIDTNTNHKINEETSNRSIDSSNSLELSLSVESNAEIGSNINSEDNILKSIVSVESETRSHSNSILKQGSKNSYSDCYRYNDIKEKLSIHLNEEDEISEENRQALISTVLFPLYLQQPETLQLIEFDLPRTFPTLGFFHDGGALQFSLERILQCYAFYRPDVGYVQGMSYLVAMLLLNMDELPAFITLANLLDRRGDMDFYKLQRENIDSYVSLFDYFFSKQLPLLFNYMKNHGITSDMYLMDWHLSLFAKSLPLEVVARIWDIYLCEGEIFLVRTGLGLLRMLAPKLCVLPLEQLMGVLMKLPDNLETDALLANIQQIHISQRKFEAIRRRFCSPTNSPTSRTDRLSVLLFSNRRESINKSKDCVIV